MAETTGRTIRLRRVDAIEANEAGATIHFAEDVVGQLSSQHDAFERALRLLRDSLDRRSCVGVRLDDGRIREVHWVDNDTPLEIDEQDKNCIRIFFQCHAGLYHLHRTHPEYPRLFALLDKAWREQTRLWFLTDLPRLTLVDLQPVDSAQPSPNGASAVGIEAGCLRDKLSTDAAS